MLDGLAEAIRSATLEDGVCLELSIRSCSLDLGCWRGLPKRSVGWCISGGSSDGEYPRRLGDESLLFEPESLPCGCEVSERSSCNSKARNILICSGV